MKNSEQIKTRFLQDNFQIQLGGLAANLARISSTSKNPDNWKTVDSVMEESKYFIEWMVPQSQIEHLILLSAIQRQLAFWQSLWPVIHTNSIECETIQSYTQKWSQEVLKLAGFLS